MVSQIYDFNRKVIAIARKKRKLEHNRTRITRGKDSYGVHDIKATKTLKRDASKHLCLSCFTKYRVPNFYTVKITNECSSSNNCRRHGHKSKFSWCPDKDK